MQADPDGIRPDAASRPIQPALLHRAGRHKNGGAGRRRCAPDAHRHGGGGRRTSDGGGRPRGDPARTQADPGDVRPDAANRPAQPALLHHADRHARQRSGARGARRGNRRRDRASGCRARHPVPPSPATSSGAWARHPTPPDDTRGGPGSCCPAYPRTPRRGGACGPGRSPSCRSAARNSGHGLRPASCSWAWWCPSGLSRARTALRSARQRMPRQGATRTVRRPGAIHSDGRRSGFAPTIGPLDSQTHPRERGVQSRPHHSSGRTCEVPAAGAASVAG